MRHPDMPGGAFHLLWERLLSGRAMAAYVLNLAKDGRHYWVFATVSPLGPGFLSVRMAPRAALLAPAWELYQDVVEAEARARRRGATREQAAALGGQLIIDGLAQLGFADYDAFMAAALPAEVAARAGLIDEHWSRPYAQGPVAGILHGAVVLDDHLRELVGRLHRYGSLAGALEASCRSVLAAAEQLNGATAAAREASREVADRVPVLRNVSSAMFRPSAQTVQTLQAVVADLSGLGAQVAEARWRIALARSHNDMVAAFAAEVIDREAPASALGEVPLLCDALAEGVEEMAVTVGRMNLRLAEVGAALERAGELFNDVRRLIGQWRLLVLRHQAGPAVAQSVAPIDRMLRDGHRQLADLRDLAQRCSAEVVSVDTATLDAALERIRRGVAALELSELA